MESLFFARSDYPSTRPAAGPVDGAGVLVGDRAAPPPSTARSLVWPRQLGTTWRTAWRSIAPLLQAMDDDPARFDGVTSLGVDEHLWHHVDERRRGPTRLPETGITYRLRMLLIGGGLNSPQV